MLTYIGEIAEKVPFIHKCKFSSDVNVIFESSRKLEGVVIHDDDDKIVGLVMKVKFYQKLAGKYGFDLFMGRPVELVMDDQPLVIDYFTPITDVSTLAVEREQDNMYDYVIIEKDSHFYGIVSIKDLLQTFAEIQTYMARYSNPLTGLPGNTLIEEQLTNILQRAQYSVLYFDLNHFKTYNDTYGFKQGDCLLRETASLLQKRVGNENGSFLGHIGGDDFIGILPHHNFKHYCECIIHDFSKLVHTFYRKDDLKRGYLFAKNRNNEFVRTPLVSIAIAVITNRRSTYETSDELSELASSIKALCKQYPHSYYIADAPKTLTYM
ncbi:diguanylate cyclase [Pontibacillus halophilus JSM 076056 = DSM 19796]|uniref:Diguanylate cyclase n=1 Tax=Pontibacillus halophilus JSM 076056 = DSM 19796 TaxID=1385510 RepID=A0A0A5GRA4_9BACI|nr:GGDEF domain-containing protein [Pontibacillus halophilus]KGX93788.1 diguanylate cyclase [Pontibacillus halophilus JSM 076056 = DSM 19796]